MSTSIASLRGDRQIGYSYNMRWSPFFLFLAGCPIEAQFVDTDHIPNSSLSTMDSGTAPTVTIDGPKRSKGEVSLHGIVVDADQPVVSLTLRLESSIDGLLWRGNPGGNGTWAWDGYLTLEEHDITVLATDSEGNVASAIHTVKLGDAANRSPLCVIASPTSNADFDSGEVVGLESDVSDQDGDELTVSWSSSVQGILGIGPAFEVSLDDGTHTITIDVTDHVSDPCSDEVVITVGAP